MNDKKYKKTYKPFIAWLIGCVVIANILAQILPNLPIKVAVLVSLIVIVISLYILMLIIYKGEYVYWINGGPSYEEAESADSEERKKYAKIHLDKFLKIMLISFLYAIISLLFKFPVWSDTFILCLVISEAVSTILP